MIPRMLVARCWLWVVVCTACGADPDRVAGAAADRMLDELTRPRAVSVASASDSNRAWATEGPALTQLLVHHAQDADASAARAVLRVQGEPPFRRSQRAASEHSGPVIQLIFEGAAVEPALLGERVIDSGGLHSVRVYRVDDVLRVDFELARDARYRLFSMSDPDRFVLDVERVRPAERGARRAQKLLVLDPGHGGEDLGSPGPHGLWEGRLTLELSRRVKAWLARLAPDIRVRLTRDSNVYLSLEERAAMANSLGADLFVSVHLNAANTPVDKGGVAAFVLDINNDRNVLRLAARENGTSTDAVSPLQFLVGSIARSEQQRASLAAATMIQRGTLFSGRRLLPTLADRGVKCAMFYVLVGAQMPAVLIEASFITQPDEAKALTLPAYRDALAEGIARGISKVLTGP